MKLWKLVSLVFVYSVVAGLFIGWQLPQRAYAYDVCTDGPCGPIIYCQTDICCVDPGGCSQGMVKRNIRGYIDQYCSSRCTKAVGCFVTCYPSK
jgi:hypothetical protein